MLADVLRVALERVQVEGREHAPEGKLLTMLLELETGEAELVPRTFWHSGVSHQGVSEVRVMYRRKRPT